MVMVKEVQGEEMAYANAGRPRAQGTYREGQLDAGQNSLGETRRSNGPESQPSVGDLILEPGRQ